MTDYQRLNVRTSGETTILDIKQRELAELDCQEQLRDELLNLVATTSPQRLIISLKGIEMIGSNAIGILVDTLRAVNENGGQMVLCDLHSTARMSFAVLNLDGTLFKIFDTESDALAGRG